ncbi:hypothetical protein IAT40_007946 [Kwoniella sp. CBS 6097]
MILGLIGLITALLVLLLWRTWSVLPRHRQSPPSGNQRAKQPIRIRKAGEACSIAVFLGSGGHTSEMRALLSTLPFERYTPRTYVYCHGDEMSLKAVASLESDKGTLTSSNSYNLLPLPRARKVAESLPSTLISATKTLVFALHHIFLLPFLRNPTKPFADVLLVNGPGTCVVLVLVSYIRRILGLTFTKIIYVESFARVKSLSLSGKLVRPFVDRFIVQWPDAAAVVPEVGSNDDNDRTNALGKGKAECRGWLV